MSQAWARELLLDFRSNGILLPATEELAAKVQLPLHRGPNPRYTQLVEDRLNAIFRSTSRSSDQIAILRFRIHQVQNGLRRGLIRYNGGCFRLNRRDPLQTHVDFAAIDDVIDRLFQCGNLE
jgi:hypothetical protein